MRMLRDRAALLRRLAAQAAARGHEHSVQTFRRRAGDAEQQADAVLAVLRESTGSALDEVEDEEVA
jgi:hypothetical protein